MEINIDKLSADQMRLMLRNNKGQYSQKVDT